MSRLTIRDLETLSGIKAHTIRIWEQRYQFLKPRRTETNIRYYCASELKLVLDISLLNKAGYRVSQINQLTSEQMREKISTLKDDESIRENTVNELIGAMAELDLDRFEKIIYDYTKLKGIEATVMELIYPFLEKSGLLWRSGHLDTAQEQLVSHVIRQKLIVAIETTVPKQEKNKTFLLFLPEGDHHELGLLFVYYLLKRGGSSAIYLGANVPVSDVAHIANMVKPDAMVIHLIAGNKAIRFDKYIQQLNQKVGGVKIIVSGKSPSGRGLGGNVEWRSMEDFMKDS